MQILVAVDSVKKLWKIRYDFSFKRRSKHFLPQSFVGVLIFSFVPWLLAGFDSDLARKYMFVIPFIALTEALLLICIYLVQYKVFFKDKPMQYLVLFATAYDTLSLIWVSWIFFEIGDLQFFKQSATLSPIQSQIQSFVLSVLLVVTLMGATFSAPVLKRKAENDSSFGDSKTQKLTNILVGIGAGVGLIFANLYFTINGIEIRSIFVYCLSVASLYALAFSATLNLIEFLYFVKFRDLLA